MNPIHQRWVTNKAGADRKASGNVHIQGVEAGITKLIEAVSIYTTKRVVFIHPCP